MKGHEYRLGKATFNRLTNKRGHFPTCRRCGKPLSVGETIVSKDITSHGKKGHYHVDCFEKMAI